MRVPVFLALSYLVVAVWAGGYAGCLERIWLYRAYKIDELNDEADRTVGYKCKRWDQPKKLCTNDEWVPCRPKRKGETRCNYGELVVHLGKTDGDVRNWEVKNADGTSMNIEESGKRCVERYKSRKTGVYNFPGFVAIKGGVDEWVDSVKKIGDAVNKTRRSKKTAQNQDLFAQFDDMTDKILTARAGDHGAHAIEEAEKDLGAEKIVKRDLGPDPTSTTTPPKHWFSVDWEETKNKLKGNPDDLATLDRNFNNLYNTDLETDPEQQGKKHQAVINAFKQVKEETAKCT